MCSAAPAARGPNLLPEQEEQATLQQEGQEGSVSSQEGKEGRRGDRRDQCLWSLPPKFNYVVLLGSMLLLK